jgi:hypothetical protein
MDPDDRAADEEEHDRVRHPAERRAGRRDGER